MTVFIALLTCLLTFGQDPGRVFDLDLGQVHGLETLERLDGAGCISESNHGRGLKEGE